MGRVRLTPKSWDEKKAEQLKHAFGRLEQIGSQDNYTVDPDDEFNYLRKAEEMAYQANKFRMSAAAQRAKNRNISVANSRNTTPDINIKLPNQGAAAPVANNQVQAFIDAIGGKESGGNYGVVNADSGALGKYQIMPANIAGQGRGWDFDALGRDISAQRFLSTPQLQERIAKTKLTDYYKKYGPAGAASAWYSGSPDNWDSTKSQGKYPSVNAYVLAILKELGLA